MGARSSGQVDGHSGEIHRQRCQMQRPPTPFGTLAPVPPVCIENPFQTVTEGQLGGGGGVGSEIQE